MLEKENLQGEEQTLGTALDLLCDDGNDYDTMIILGAEHLSPAMKQLLGIKKED